MERLIVLCPDYQLFPMRQKGIILGIHYAFRDNNIKLFKTISIIAIKYNLSRYILEYLKYMFNFLKYIPRLPLNYLNN